jgi:hypothetical protein
LVLDRSLRPNAIARFAAQEGLQIAEPFTEVETAKGDTLARHPKLAAALKAAARSRRLSSWPSSIACPRTCIFISGLTAERVPFNVAKLGPDSDPFMLHIHAALAGKECQLISTKSGLEAAKRRGIKLGGRNAQPDKAAAKATVGRAVALDQWPNWRRIGKPGGGRTQPRKFATALGGQWFATQVIRLQQWLARRLSF